MSVLRHRPLIAASAVLLTAVIAACGGGGDAPAAGASGDAPAAAESPSAQLPPETGTVHTIEMIMDDDGNYYKPAEIEAKPGDKLRFVLVSGVHNVHFVADSNPGVIGLPPAGPMLQAPGQVDEVIVPDAVGKRLFYQCDPHALLGMVGHVTVVQ